MTVVYSKAQMDELAPIIGDMIKNAVTEKKIATALSNSIKYHLLTVAEKAAIDSSLTNQNEPALDINSFIAALDGVEVQIPNPLDKYGDLNILAKEAPINFEGLTRSYLTVQKGEETRTFDFSSPDFYASDFYNFVCSNIEGTGFAFVSLPGVLVSTEAPNPLEGLEGIYGLNAEGKVVINGEAKDFVQNILTDYYHTSTLPFLTKAEDNVLVFKPTPDVAQEQDYFYLLQTVPDTSEFVIVSRGLIKFSQDTVKIKNSFENHNNWSLYFAVDIDGVKYNENKSEDISAIELPGLSVSMGSEGGFSISNISKQRITVKLTPSEDQRKYSDAILTGSGSVDPVDGTLTFTLDPMPY